MRPTRARDLRLLSLLLAGLGSALLGYSAPGAARASTQATGFTLEGKITRISAGKLTLSTEENMVFQVRYEKAEITRQDGSKGSAKDLRPGLRVKVEGDLTESGEVVAAKIDIKPTPTTKEI